MQTQERSEYKLPKNFYSVDNLGNRLQSIWEAEKKNFQLEDGDTDSKLRSDQKDSKSEFTRLEEIFDLHWLYRLGVDVYAKPIEQLQIKDILWNMGRLLFVCIRLSSDEGEMGVAAKRLSKNYYDMLAYLRQHHDQLHNPLKETKHPSRIINDDDFDTEEEDLDIENPQRTSNYRILSSGYGYSYDPFPDFYWWQGFGSGTSHHHDPLMCLISPDYASGEAWGYIVDYGIGAVDHGTRALIHVGQQLAPGVEHVVNVGIHGAIQTGQQIVPALQHGIQTGQSLVQTGISGGENLLHSGIHEIKGIASLVDHQAVSCCQGMESGVLDCCSKMTHCFSGTFSSLFNCGSGVCDMLGNCCGGVGNFLSGCAGVICNFNCNCDCGGGGEGCCGICATGIGGCGYLCSRICCPDSCSDSSSATNSGDNGGVHHGLGGHESLMKMGATHLSVPASTFFAPTIGTYLMGVYSLVVGTPVVYNLGHSVIKLIKGGDHKQTASRDRIASAKDLFISSVTGAALFFGGWFVPYGGPHTAVMIGTFGTYLGNVLSKRQRKHKEYQTFGGHPYKPQKYVPTMEVMEQLYHDHEFEEQPGLSLQDRAQEYQAILASGLQQYGGEDQKTLPGKSRAGFLAAQERLDIIGTFIKICGNTAFYEKNQVLETHSPFTHGLRGLAKGYGSLFGGHHTTTSVRVEALSAIMKLHEGSIAEAQAFVSRGVLPSFS